MVEMAIRADMRDYTRLLDEYPKAMRQAVPRAINKTLAQANVAGVRAMSRRYNLPRTRIKRGVRIRKATVSKAEGAIIAQESRRAGIGTDRPGLIGYRGTSQKVRTKGGVRKLSRAKSGGLQASQRTFKSAGTGGVSYAIIKGRKKRDTKAFIAAIAQGGARTPNVFKRTGVKKVPRKGSYKGRTITRGPFRGLLLKREVIKRMVGPSIPSMFLVEGRPAAANKAREIMPRILDNQVQFALRQVRQRKGGRR